MAPYFGRDASEADFPPSFPARDAEAFPRSLCSGTRPCGLPFALLTSRAIFAMIAGERAVSPGRLGRSAQASRMARRGLRLPPPPLRNRWGGCRNDAPLGVALCWPGCTPVCAALNSALRQDIFGQVLYSPRFPCRASFFKWGCVQSLLSPVSHWRPPRGRGGSLRAPSEAHFPRKPPLPPSLRAG